MTLGIAVVCRDGVLLVADRRLSRLRGFGAIQVRDDDYVKVDELPDGVHIAHSANIEGHADALVQTIRAHDTPQRGGVSVTRHVERIERMGAREYRAAYDDDPPPAATDDWSCIQLLVAGFELEGAPRVFVLLERDRYRRSASRDIAVIGFNREAIDERLCRLGLASGTFADAAAAVRAEFERALLSPVTQVGPRLDVRYLWARDRVERDFWNLAG